MPSDQWEIGANLSFTICLFIIVAGILIGRLLGCGNG
jgi:hypothetical protein